MIIKTSLFFRKALRKKFKENEYFEVHFLDENDSSYIFNFPCIEENNKFLKYQKDTKVDLELLLYSPSDKTKAKYCLWVV